MMDAPDPNSFFGRLPPRARSAIEAASRSVSFAEGKLIVGEGDDSTDLYILLDGIARSAVFTENGREVSFHDVEPGGCFGEISAIDLGPRSASVIALTDCTALALSANSLARLVETDAEIAMALMRLM